MNLLNTVTRQKGNQTTCMQYVRSVLRANRWLLVEPETFSAEIWQLVQNQPDSKQHLHQAIMQQYGIVLHNSCRAQVGWRYEAAWRELARWLRKCVWRVTQNEALHERLVQESLIALERCLAQKPLDAPAAIWAYALQIMRHRNIDLYRMATAEKRRENQQLSLEQLQDESRAWEERLADIENEPLPEHTMISAEMQTQLSRFFSAELATLLQQKVATLHFCEGLAPKQIAAKLNKTPHEIRMVKARVLKRLRTLPPDKQAALLA